ncbi:glycosyltransferase [Actinomadura parmotrematis]|uniref:Erythromycin biosynthesis protein CIII-like C-terminal domain-containing protein n=1 Tax=Actinomadura parmotrematis TaxID=2864039 RepID=A0ABS7FV56_9ACTN|nr:nucleotide disphospho-sugar-binding domain-containing protein [Actinomadura parmotrematis]MBW8484304.1 hypothetical protein [Actinomadura parmotrematis]
MRILVCAIGQLGHLNPMIAIALRLRAAGHDARIATGPGVAGYARAAGVPALAMGTGGELRKDFATEAEGRGAALLDREAPRWIGDLLAYAADWPPDLVVRQWMEGASLVAAERLGVPHVVCEVCLRLPERYREYDPAARTARAYGVAPGFAEGSLWLSCFPPSFARPGTPRKPHEHHVKPLLYDRHGPRGADGLAAGADGAPLVYATLGTMYNQVPHVFESLVEAFAGEDYRVVISTGPDRDPGSVKVRSLPPNVRVTRYVPNSAIVPRADAVISHGGFSTVMAALAHGVPLGLVPLGSDHGTNSGRCVDLGAGLRYPHCRTEPYVHVPPADVAAGPLREMARELLADGRYREAAGRLRDEMAALPGHDRAVELIEAVPR